MTTCYKRWVVLALGALLVAWAALAGAGCGGEQTPGEVVLVTHDSFAIADDVKAAFEEQSGLTLRILQTGDAGVMVNRALLTAGNPEGDVLFGVDDNLLSRALEGDLFEAYEPPALEEVDPGYVLDPEHRATPVDHGEVCLNVDKGWFAARDIPQPTSISALTDPRYEGLTVVENPATSTPGLAFLLATVARFGEGGWQEFWRRARDNGVLVVDGWEEAYTVRFSGAGGSKGNRPIVVSYASSPPAEVMFAGRPLEDAPTAVIEDSCFRQVELAGVLRGAANPDGARALIDFMLSRPFQEGVPETMFVFPVTDVPLPEVFEEHAVVPESPLELSPEEIEANRDEWIDEWTSIVLR